MLHLPPKHETLWGQEVGFNAYLTPAPGKDNIRKREKAQALTRQEAGWVREAVLKLLIKETSLSHAQSTSHSLCHYCD